MHILLHVGDEKLKFSNDQELIKFALTTLQGAPDPDELVCNESTTLERKSLKFQDGKSSLHVRWRVTSASGR